MRSSFLGLSIGLRAMQANQQSLDTASHNIANANTPGYSRQEVLLTASHPYTCCGVYPGQIGTGVAMVAIQRFRNAFMDNEIRKEQRTLGEWEVRQNTLGQLETILPEPSESGLSKIMDRFWNAWQDLSNEPQNTSMRAALRQQASNLAFALNHTSQQLTSFRQDLDTQVGIKAQEINSIASEIASLNGEIQKALVAGNSPNDLRDQRDLLLDQLGKMVNINYSEQLDGSMNVYIGSGTIVSGVSASQVTTKRDAANMLQLYWAIDPSLSVQVTGGETYALLQSRDTIVAGPLTKLNQLAQALITNVNTVHHQGWTLNSASPTADGPDFFTGTDASTIALSNNIASNLDNIAAAQGANSPGDGRNAAAIANIRLQNTLGGPPSNLTITGFYSSLIIALGTDAKQADDMVKNQALLTQHLEQQRQSVSGVSLDEEAANLVKYQRSYQAAARVITTIDEMLDRLINGTGRTGL